MVAVPQERARRPIRARAAPRGRANRAAPTLTAMTAASGSRVVTGAPMGFWSCTVTGRNAGAATGGSRPQPSPLSPVAVRAGARGCVSGGRTGRPCSRATRPASTRRAGPTLRPTRRPVASLNGTVTVAAPIARAAVSASFICTATARGSRGARAILFRTRRILTRRTRRLVTDTGDTASVCTIAGFCRRGTRGAGCRAPSVSRTATGRNGGGRL